VPKGKVGVFPMGGAPTFCGALSVYTCHFPVYLGVASGRVFLYLYLQPELSFSFAKSEKK